MFCEGLSLLFFKKFAAAKSSGKPVKFSRGAALRFVKLLSFIDQGPIYNNANLSVDGEFIERENSFPHSFAIASIMIP